MPLGSQTRMHQRTLQSKLLALSNSWSRFMASLSKLMRKTPKRLTENCLCSLFFYFISMPYFKWNFSRREPWLTQSWSHQTGTFIYYGHTLYTYFSRLWTSYPSFIWLDEYEHKCLILCLREFQYRNRRIRRGKLSPVMQINPRPLSLRTQTYFRSSLF